jgi:colicin import membrane protein
MAITGFWREHGAAVAGSVVLHGLLVAVVLALSVWTVQPKVVMPATIEAYLAPSRVRVPEPAAPEPVAASVAVPAPSPEPTVVEPPPVSKASPTPAPAPVVVPPKPEPSKKQLEAQRASEAAAQKVRLESEKKRAAAEEAKRAAAAAKREAIELEARRRADEAARKKAAAAVKERAARESELERDLANEQKRLGAENSGLLNRYVAEIQARIERAWSRPPSARPGLRCEVLVTQVPGGTVTDVKIGACNGDAAVQQSISVAVFRASPLPAPPDPSLFERNLRLVFAPDA